jgi:hypothetical protein
MSTHKIEGGNGGVGYPACFTASPPVCRRLMPRPATPLNPTCVATMGLLRHRRPPPTTLPLSVLACSVVEPCSTSTTGSHGAPLICSRRTPKVEGDAGDGREARRGERRVHATRTGEVEFDCVRKKRRRWGLSRWGTQSVCARWIGPTSPLFRENILLTCRHVHIIRPTKHRTDMCCPVPSN